MLHLNYKKQSWNQFLLVVKVTALKPTNIKILFANYKRQSKLQHLYQSQACHKWVTYIKIFSLFNIFETLDARHVNSDTHIDNNLS